MVTVSLNGLSLRKGQAEDEILNNGFKLRLGRYLLDFRMDFFYNKSWNQLPPRR